ncbi:hypothetical protein SELMODRAFT_94416, partial [Selaginella moellendorffii]
ILGLARFYHKFIKYSSVIASPLSSLLYKNALFKWNEAPTSSFAQLKTVVMTALVFIMMMPKLVLCSCKTIM